MVNNGKIALGDVADLFGGGTPLRSNAEFFGGSIPWVTPSDLPAIGTVATLGTTEETLSQAGLDQSSAKLLPTKTVLFSSRATIGKIAVADRPFSTNQGFINFVPKPARLDEWYLAFYLLHALPEIERLCGETTFKEVPRTKMRAFEIPDVPVKEQRRVVSRIKECLSRVEEMQRLREEALDDASALTAAAVRERLDPLVRAGDLIPFGELVAATRLGLVRSKGEQGDGRAFAYFKMNNIARGGRVDVTSMTRVDATPQEARENALTDGDFLFNTRNSFELVGKTGVAPAFPEPLLYNNNILRVRFRDGVLSHYVNFAFQHPFVQKELNLRKSKTTNVCAVYYKSLQTLPIPFPKRADDQKEITTFLKRVESTAIAMESQLDEQESDYPALRESILREAFAGNL
jgi:type I restriction enzyme S subunit